MEVLVESIRPDSANGEAPEIPRLETSRGPGSTREVDFWTTRDVREVNKSHCRRRHAQVGADRRLLH